MSELSLAAEFPAATREAWAVLVEKVLKGADFDRTLVGRTADGIRIEPLYPKSDAPPVITARASHAPWRIAQRVDHPVATEANGLALADLGGGADALTLTFAGAPSARGFGISARDLDAVLGGVMLDLVQIRLDAGGLGGTAAHALLALAKARGHSPSSLDLDLCLDPIGTVAATGMPGGSGPGIGDLAGFAAGLRQDGFAGRILLADGRPYHEAGCSEAQELACVLATATAYLRAVEPGGLDQGDSALSFLLVADADQFLTVAKMRALRRLWRAVQEACGLAPKPIRLHAETAWRMMTRRDPWVNLLRGTTAASSAGIGGADTVTVLPFTAALGLPDAFARRLARNTQTVLLEESNLWRVDDPVAGSGGFEALTEALVAEAWRLFGEIEREGGILQSLRSGALQARIAAVRGERERSVATRRTPITGVSEFPDLREKAVGVLMVAPSRTSAVRAREDEFSSRRDNAAISPLPSRRIAEPYERLRDQSDGIFAATGERPTVYLANLGPISAFSARATFAKNAFEAVGIEAVTNDGAGAVDALASAFAASGKRLACLCSSDEIYRLHASAAAAALKAAGAKLVFMAGRPDAELRAELEAAGVDRFVHAGSDLLTVIGEGVLPQAVGGSILTS